MDGITYYGSDPLAQPFGGSLFPEGQQRPANAPTAFQRQFVNYADEQTSRAPAFVHSPDMMTLDPDAFGERTAAWAKQTGLPYDSSYVAGLNVFGRSMSREQLEQSEAGRDLLRIATDNRLGKRRGFWEALTDFEWSDLPFVGMIASVGGSIKDAVTVSDTMKKLQDGEAVTDDELIKTRLYMAEQERDSQGTWGATVGGIVRAAPGFMVEMLASGGLAAAGRAALSKAGVGATHIAMSRATKVLAKEAVEDLAEKTVAKAAGTAVKKAGSEFAELVGTEAEKNIVSSVATQLFGFMKSSEAGALYKGFSDDALMAMAKNRAQLEFGRMVARKGGTAVSNGFHTFTQWLGQNVSRGLLDFGSYGTEEATVLFTRQSTAGRALADALGVFTIEAPIKGTVLMLPKKAVEQGVIAPVFGQDGRVVGQNQLSLQASALYTGNRSLMDNAESIALGMDLLEYISENTGRGLKSLFAAGGIGLEKAGMKGLVRPLATAVSAAGNELPTEGLEAVTVGGKMRQFIRKVFGSRAEYAKKVAGQEADLVADRLGVTAAGERALVKSAVMTGNMLNLRPELRQAIGDDLEKFVADTVSKAYDDGVKNLQYKSYARYAMAKWMQKHGVGPESVMNAFNQMGYDGVLGEMFEERYSDVVKGLLGLDERPDTVKLFPGAESQETASFLNNVKEAVKGLYPGWEQLTAEAVGFMFPMVTRGVTMRAMSAIGGGGEIAQIRAKLDVIDDAMRHNTVGEMTYSEADAAFKHAAELDAREVASLQKQLEDARAAGDKVNADALQKELDTRTAVAAERLRRQKVFFDTVDDAAKNTADALIAVPLDTYGTLSSDTEGLAPVLSEAEVRQVLDAQRTLGDFASQLARQMVEGQLPVEGESEGAFRKVARKLIGVAGFLVTGDFSLASVNPAQWTARDMGLSKHVVDALRDGFREQLKKVRDEMPDDASTESVLDEAQRRFDLRARQIMTANLAVHQLRSFSDGRLRETAAAQWASTHTDADGRQWQYAIDKEGRGTFFKLSEDGKSVDEATVKSLADMYRDHKDEIDKVRKDILEATVDIMTRRLTGSDAGRNSVLSAVLLEPRFDSKDSTSDLLDVAIYDAAMHMIGAQNLIYRVSLDGQTPLKAVMEVRSLSRVSDSVVDLIASKDKVGDVDPLALESVAQSLHLSFDGTDEGYAARNDKIFRMAKLMRLARREGWLYFSKEIFDEDSLAMRLSSNGTSTLVAKRQKDGSYAVDYGAKKDNPKERDIRSFATVEELVRAMQADGYSQDEAHVVLTQTKVIESSDMFWMLRELGYAREYRDALGTRRPDQMHPMLRTDKDGKLLGQKEAEALLAKELAEANAGRTAEEGTPERAKYERVFGENGYITVGEKILADHGVRKDTLKPFIGEFHDYAPSRYTYLMSAGKISPKSADTYVVIDPGVDSDLTSGLVNAVLLEGYMRNGALLRDALGGVISDFVKDVRRIAKEALVEAEEKKDFGLASQLKSFLRTCCDDVDREVVGANGKREIKRGIGLTPTGFTVLSNAFGLFRATKDATNPMLRAVATIAPRVWGTTSFLGFEGLLNTVLGGNFLDHEVWSAKPGEKNYADPALRGVPQVMALASANPSALQDAIKSSLPAGLGYEQFLDAVVAQLSAQSKTGEPGITDVEKADLRAKARAAAAAAADPAAHFTFLGGLVSTLKAAIDRNVTTSKSVTDFLADVFAAVKNDPGATEAQRVAAQRQLDYLAKRNSDSEAEKAYIKQAEELDATRAKLEEAQRELEEARERLVELDRQSVARQAAADAGVPAAATEADEAARRNAHVAVADAAAKVKDLEDAVVKKQEAAGASVPEGVRALNLGGDTKEDDGVGAAIRDVDYDNPENMDATIANDPLGMDVPEVFEREAAKKKDGFIVEWGRTTEDVNRRLTRRQAKLAAGIVVRSLAGVDEDAVEARIKELFPHMQEEERADVVAGYRNLDAMRIAEGKTWRQMVVAGRHFGFDEDEKSDESVASDNFNERALAEYNDESMKDFAALASRAASETMGSIMGFVRQLRGRVRKLAAGSSENDLLRGLLCPQLRPGLKSLAQADAYHKQTLERFDSGSVQADIEALVKTDPPAAFLVSYLSSLPVNARTRFAGLCSGAVAASPLHVVDGIMTPRPSMPDGKIPDSLVVDSVDVLVGMSARRIGKAADKLLKGAESLKLLDKGDDYTKLRHNAEQVAELLATVFGRNNPLYTALTSDIAHEAWATDKHITSELLKAVSATPDGVGVVNTIVHAMKALAERGHEPSRLEVESMFIAAFTMGGFGGNVGLKRAPMHMDTTDPLLTFLNMFQAGLPRTMMRSEIDQKRDRSSSSVVVAPRGMVPLLSRWLYQEGEGSFAEVCRAAWPGVSDETLAECRQDGTWPDDARTPICAKCLSSSLTPREVYRACRDSARSGKGLAWVPLYSGDHSTTTLLQVPEAARKSGFVGLPSQIVVGETESVDGVGIVWEATDRKNGSSAWFDRADGKIHVNAEGVRQKFRDGAHLKPLRSGPIRGVENIKTEDDLIKWVIYHELAHKSLPRTKDENGNRVPEALEIENRANEMASIRAGFYRKPVSSAEPVRPVQSATSVDVEPLVSQSWKDLLAGKPNATTVRAFEWFADKLNGIADEDDLSVLEGLLKQVMKGNGWEDRLETLILEREGNRKINEGETSAGLLHELARLANIPDNSWDEDLDEQREFVQAVLDRVINAFIDQAGIALTQPTLTRVKFTTTNPHRDKDERKFNKLGGLTKFIGFGTGSTGQYAKDLAAIANKEDYVADDIVGVSVNGKRPGAVPVRGTDVERLVRRAAAAGATIIADDEKHRNNGYNVGEVELAKLLEELGYSDNGGTGVWRKAGVEATEEQTRHQAEKVEVPAPPVLRQRVDSKDYKALGKAVYRAIGMHLMFTDTKRSAVSSLEAQGTGLVGESNGKYGEHRVHIVHSFAKNANNESFLGSTYMHGYGVRQIGNMSADPDSDTKKVHIVGGAGRDLFFIKSLTISQTEGRGKFRKGSAPRAVFNYLEKFRGNDPLSTDTMTDDDSYKIGPGNSKGLRVVNDGKDATVMGYVFDRLIHRLVEAGDLREGYSQDELSEALKKYNRMTGDELDEAVGPLTVEDRARGGTQEMKLSEVMPGAMVNVFEGWNGPALDLSYREDSAMAYTVANVAHDSSVPSDPGRSPRNYEVDALAMVRTLAAGGWLKTPGLARDLQNLVADWGLLASSVYMHPKFREALVRTNENLAELMRNGEFVSSHGTFSGQFAVEEMVRQMMAKMRQAANLPMRGIDAPLQAAGAAIGPNGELLYHGASEMERDMLKGSELFSDEEREFYGTSRRLALCNVNITNNGFRYGWFLDEDAIAREKAKPDGLVAAAYRFAETSSRAGGNPGRVHAVAIGWLAEQVRNRTRRIADSEDRAAAQREALEARTAFASMFVDHHGTSIAKYGPQYLKTYSVEDLFVPSSSDADSFDYSAVQCEGQDLVHCDATGKRHVFLGGTAFGFPRTPSYNGSPWLQVVRAGLPVTERDIADAKPGERTWLPGLDAKVQPDPYTNDILGCDHDGDKAKLYMFGVNGLGDVQFAAPPHVDADAASFVDGTDGKAARSGYLKNCAAAGFVEHVRLDEDGNEVVVDEDTPDSYYRISELARKKTSNSFVRALFSMARQLPVDAVVESGNEVRLVPRNAPDANSASPRTKFRGGVASSPTSAFPGGKAAKNAVLAESGMPPLLVDDGSKGTLGDPELAADVETSADDAGDARGVMVSLARTLHMAWALGAYSGEFEKNSEYASLLGPMTGADWLNFMHLVDGISNATFDDIKEQLCGRLGWTKGMMDSVVTELLMWPKTLPKTKSEFLKVVKNYAHNVKTHGSRYWMLRNSKVDDAEAHKVVISSFTGETRYWVGRARLMERLGLEMDDEKGLVASSGASKTIGTAIGAVIAKLPARSSLFSFMTRDQGANPAMGLVYYAVVRGLHNAGLDEMIKTESDSEGMPVYSFSADRSLTQEQFDKVVETIGASFGRMHVDQWARRRGLLLDARAVAQSVLYLTADPGAPTADSAKDRMARTFETFNENGGLDSDKTGALPADCVKRMHEATMLLYNVGEDLYTCVSRAVSSLSRRNDYVAELASTESGKTAAGRLLAKDTVSSYDLLTLQNNQQQVPLLAEFFTGALDDVLAPTGLTGRGTYDLLKKFAANIADAGEFSTGAMAGAGDLVQAIQNAQNTASSADKAAAIGTLLDKLREGFAPMPLAARAAFESMISICYELMVTSTEFQADDANRAVQFLRMSPDGAFAKRNSDGEFVARAGRNYGLISADMRKVMPTFRANDQQSLDKIRAMFEKVIAGAAFTTERSLPGEAGRFTKAKSFSISRRNLADYARELVGGKVAPKTLEDIEKLGLPPTTMRNIRYAWQALGDDETVATPSMLFGALLPAYTLMTSRMAGVPSVESRSVLTCLPERYYSALSSAEALRRASGDRVVPLMVGCNWAVEQFQTDLDKLVEPAETYELDAYADLDEARAALRGGHGRKEFRKNPVTSNTVDIFDPAFEEALSALREGTGPVASLPKATSVGHLSSGAYDAKTAKLALAMGALLGSWAKVEYNGGKTFTISGDLRGDAGTGKAVTIVVDTSDRNLIETEEDVERYANSPAYAASLTEAVDLGMTAEEFMILPKETRKAFVRKFGIGGSTSGKVAWSVSARGVATLVGRISLPAGGTKIYHEYFHSMMRMFESFGLFGKEDYEQLRKTFGEDPAKRHQFNEEKAAEAFRKWVEGKTDRDAAEVRGVFKRILDFLKGLLEALKLGFSFEDREGAETLFKMMVHGIAQPSTARLGEAKLEQTAAASAIHAKFSMPRAPRARRSEMVAAAEQQKPSAPASLFLELEDDPDFDTVTTDMKERSARAEKALQAVLDDPEADISQLFMPLRNLLEARRDIARLTTGGLDELTGGFPASDDASTDDFTVGDPVADELKKVTSPLINNNRFYRTANSIREALEHGLRETGAWTDDLEYVVRRYAANDAQSAQDEALRKRSLIHGLRRAMERVNPEAAKSVTNEELESSLAFRAALVMHQHLESSFLSGRSAGASPATEEATRHATQYQVSAWIMSTDPTAPSDMARNARARVSDLYNASRSPQSRAELKLILDQMDKLDSAVGDPTGLSRFRRDQGMKTLNDVIMMLRAGTKRPTTDDEGRLNNIEPIDVVDPNGDLSDPANTGTANPMTPVHLPSILNSHNDPAVQEALKLALTTAYQIAAMAKFYGDLDVHPAPAGDIAEAKRLARLNGIPEHMSSAEFLGEHLVGDSNLVDNPAYVDYACQSHFIAQNVDAWLRSMVRDSFGAHDGLGQMMSDEHFEYKGLISKITLKENWIAHMLGVSLEPGGQLLKVIRQKGEYKLEDGEVIRKIGDEFVRFDNYGRKKTSVVMTEEDLRRIDYWYKMCTAHASGQKHVVTGVDDLSFYRQMSRKPEDYSIEAVTAKRARNLRMNPAEWAVWRMTRQIPADLLPEVHSRFVSAILDAMAKADAMMANETHIRGPHGTETEPAVHDAATYNSYVIDRLVRAGVVVGYNPGGARHAKGGLARYENAALLVGCDFIDAKFKDSDTYHKLVDEDKGARDPKWVDRDFIRDELMSVWEDTARFVKRHPWLTHGDGQYFHAFGTALPFWRGSGIFMYNAVRTDRQNRLTPSDKMSEAERVLERIMSSQAANEPLAGSDNGQFVSDADFLARFVGAEHRGAQFLQDIVEGKYEAGEDLSVETGLVLPADATYGDLAKAIYQKARELVWASRTGDAGKDHRDLEGVIERYEATRLERGEPFGGTLGFKDTDMYRMHGTLPANYQLGHKVHKCIDGITNAMMSRATLANLLLTPEGSTGAPVYYADPNELAAEASGLPDSFWGNLAEWWQEHNRETIGQVYDPAKSGVQNAKEVYKKIHEVHQIKGKKNSFSVGSLGYTELPGDDSTLVSVDHWMVLDGNGDDFMNATCGGEAAGYLKHFLNSSRIPGLGSAAVRAAIQRAVSYSKSLSVSFSFFFPLATRWESPFGAVGALSTIGSNWKAVGDWMKEHPDAANKIRGMFGGKAWITHNYIGMKDIVRMMDSNDPFLAELYSWAAALGISVSTGVTNPMEPDKTVLLKDIRRMKEAIRSSMGAAAAGKFARMMDALLVRQGDKAFNYVLNATKLAVVAQLCMKLRHQAKAQGKAFDPVRDLRKYSRYINAEIGGIDPMQFAWAHPMARRLMNMMFFSWNWTVGAWQAGGGSVITDLLTGSKTMTRQERAYFAGRWVRMFFGVMIGVPALFQALTMIAAKLLGGGDDDDDHWGTWENEDKTKWSAFDLTPLLKAIAKADETKLGGVVRRFKEHGGAATAALGAVGGAVAGGLGGGNWLTSVLGGALGAGAGAFAPRIVPLYTGNDAANRTTRNRRYYMHFGKQGWEFFRWFDDARGQFFSKLSMNLQRVMEGVMGRSLGYLERSLPWDEMGQFERWMSPTTDSALFNIAEAYLSFSISGMNRNGDAGILPIFGPVQMGISQTAAQKKLVAALKKWADNDRRAYAFGRPVKGKKTGKPKLLVENILDDARKNGFDPAKQLDKACGQVLRQLYGRLCEEIPDNPGDDYDVAEVSKIGRSILRLGGKKRNAYQSLKTRFETAGRKWKTLPPEARAQAREVVNRGLTHPFDY